MTSTCRLISFPRFPTKRSLATYTTPPTALVMLASEGQVHILGMILKLRMGMVSFILLCFCFHSVLEFQFGFQGFHLALVVCIYSCTRSRWNVDVDGFSCSCSLSLHRRSLFFSPLGSAPGVRELVVLVRMPEQQARTWTWTWTWIGGNTMVPVLVLVSWCWSYCGAPMVLILVEW